MSKRLAITFVMITVVIDSMGIGLMMPVMPDLLQELGADDLSRAAIWGGFLSMLFALMQFLFGPYIGALSDRFGRRPVLLLSLVVVMFDYLLLAVAGTIWLVILARIIAGIASATQSTASAYMADISKPEEKAQNFGLVGAAFGIGFVLGPLIGGLLSELGTRAPFYAAAILAGANLVLGYFAFPETVTDKIRRKFEWRRANPFGAFSHVGKLPQVGRMLLVVLVYNFAFMIYPAVWSFFTQEAYGWTARDVGISLAAFGITIAFIQGFAIRYFILWMGEARTAIFGLSMNVIAFTLFVFTNAGWQAYAIIGLTTLGVVTMPSLQGMMAQRVSDDAQGELQGVLVSTQSISSIVSPVVMTAIFGFFTSAVAPIYLPGAPFALAALLTLTGLVLFLTRRQPAPAPA
ncbi:MAG: TCR/Tet family MFS transporter [Pseudomonadota bacterium]